MSDERGGVLACRPSLIGSPPQLSSPAAVQDPGESEGKGDFPMRHLRGLFAALLIFGIAATEPGAERRGARGPGDLGRSHLARPDLVRPRGDARDRHAVHGALRAARRDGEADAGQRHGAEPGRVVEPVQGRPRLRVRASPGREIPQRRPRHRRRREVLLRALSGRSVEGDEGQSRRGRGRGRAVGCASGSRSRGPIS